MQGSPVCAGRWLLVLAWVMKANAKTIGLMLKGNPCHDQASQVPECLQRYAGVPCWDLEVPRPWREDAGRVMDLSVFGAAMAGHSWATHLLFQLTRIAFVA